LIVFDILLDAEARRRHRGRMSSWSQFELQAPALAASVRTRLDAHVHKTIATLRRDGSPRISGTECRFADGELWIGSMWQALKARDLQRDPRYALHSGSDDPPEWPGDAKLSGVVEEITDPEVVRKMNGEAAEGPSHLFRLDLSEVSVVGLNEARDKIVIELWHPGEEVRRIERA
jgi:Pyridoxamine 5'-phosphate oxidase